MLLKYLDLHNKILRDAKDPEEVAQELIKNGYYVIGVNSHNDGAEVKNKEHYYRFFETHFELFEKKGLLMLPAVEIKIRDNNYSALSELIKEFSRKFILIKHKGEEYHVPFMIFVHGVPRVNEIAVKEEKLDILCHPLKEGGKFNIEMAKEAAKNDIGIEINYREYRMSKDKEKRLKEQKNLLATCHKAGNKVFLFTATIKKGELVHINELIEYGNKLHEDLVDESIENVHELLMKKYRKLLEQTEFSLENMRKKHGLKTKR